MDMVGKYENQCEEEEENLHSIQTVEKFAIGQRAYLLQTPQGNILWDCVSLLDTPTIELVKIHGGISAIAISHPHYYSSMVEWSEAFGGVPVYLHHDCAKWVMRKEGNLQFWSGETKQLAGGVTLIRTGGHFTGFQVLHSARHAGGRGALFAGDQPRVCMDRRWATFMYSFPNYIPLSPTAVRNVIKKLAPYEYDRLYGAVPGYIISEDAKGAVERSSIRYLDAMLID